MKEQIHLTNLQTTIVIEKNRQKQVLNLIEGGQGLQGVAMIYIIVHN